MHLSLWFGVLHLRLVLSSFALLQFLALSLARSDILRALLSCQFHVRCIIDWIYLHYLVTKTALRCEQIGGIGLGNRAVGHQEEREIDIRQLDLKLGYTISLLDTPFRR